LARTVTIVLVVAVAGLAVFAWLRDSDEQNRTSISAASVREIQEQVEQIRGLESSRPIQVELLSNAAFRARLRKLFSGNETRRFAALEGRFLATLGAIPPDADLFELVGGSLEEQAIGAYVPKTKELLVRSSGEFGALERVTLAHELTHALVDRRFGLPESPESDLSGYDSLIAAQSLGEGDAELVTERYATRHVGLGELLSLVGDPELLEQEELGTLPYYLRRELIAPYLDGLRFVRTLHRQGGWEAVNDAYVRAPTGTDQILFPGSDRELAEPPDLGSPGAGWSKRFETDFGPAPLLWLFEAPGDRTERAVPGAEQGVAAWRGGELTLWTEGPSNAVGLALVEPRDQRALCALVAAWYVAAFPEARPSALRPGERLALESGEQAAALRCPAGEVRLGIAPGLAAARWIAGA
jgi:hypothetical protein